MSEPIMIGEAMQKALAEIPLTLTQVASILGVSVQTCINYRHRGMLPKKFIQGREGYSAYDVAKLKRLFDDE